MSSSDPAVLGLTVRGFLVGLVPLVVLLTGLSEAEINPIIDAIVALVTAASIGVSAAMVLVGLIRKVYFRITDKQV